MSAPTPPAPRPAAGPRIAAVLLAVLGALLLVSLAARSHGDIDVRPRPSSTTTAPPTTRATSATPVPPTLPPTARAPHAPGWLTPVIVIALVLLAVPVLVWLARRVRRYLALWGGRRRAAPPVRLGAAPTEDDLVDEALSAAVDEGLSRLASGPVRDAIVACWVELERAAATSGVPRLPSETSAELATRLLGLRRVDPVAVERLGVLYREARFSTHRMDERARSEARYHLEQVRADLTGDDQ